MPTEDNIQRLRLVRAEGVGPITCRRLLDRYVSAGDLGGLLADLRATYRLAGEEKLRALGGVS